MNFKKVTIIGDGAMGSICAMLLCPKGLDVVMWGHNTDHLREFKKNRENTKYLPGYKLPENLSYAFNDADALDGTDLVISAVPCQYTRVVWERLKKYMLDSVPVVSVTKGIENSTLFRPTQILEQVLGSERCFAALSGPMIADELARGLPATACIASCSAELNSACQDIFTTNYFRVYTNEDIVGVELSGAMKNVIAIAAGIVDGIDLGNNAKAALLTRGLTEISRLGLAMGAKAQTFAGLSGLGDLVTTCISPLGRNRSFGERIGKGMNAQEALAATESVVEGESTCKSIVKLAESLCVEIPITYSVYEIIIGQTDVRQAIGELMSREPKPE